VSTPSAGAELRLERVHRSWGKRSALEEVDLSIKPGERVLLAGPSGSGKTTLLRLLAGALRPTSGTVHVDGVDLLSMSSAELRRHRARCRIVEQGGLLVPQSDVHHNVLAGRLADMSWHAILWSAIWRTHTGEVRRLLEPLGIADRQWDLAGQLSGGQQQRVAIARALISSPAILLADEPTSSLDPRTAADVTQLLVDQASQRGATLVFCSHWLSLARTSVDRIVGIRAGRVVLDARAADVSDDALDRLYRGSDEKL
jgi:phosphonate transport system ATP-binding protein